MSVERWHEIHDAYVAFFGDEHRPAAVLVADRQGRPTAVTPTYGQTVDDGYLATLNRIQIVKDEHRTRLAA